MALRRMAFDADIGEMDWKDWYRGWVYVAPEVGPGAIRSRIVKLWAWGSPWTLREPHPRTFYAAFVRNLWLEEYRVLRAMAPYRAFASRPWLGSSNGWTEMFRCNLCFAVETASEATGITMTPLRFDPATNEVTRAVS